MESAAVATAFVQLLVIVLLSLFLHFLPSIIGFKRRVRTRVQVLIVNLFLGWTFIGWVVALVWACSPSVDQKTA